MTLSIAAVLLILVVALVLFVTEAIRVEVTAMLVLLSLTLTGIITSDQAIQGFSNPAVVTIVAVFVLSGGLFCTGVANFLGRQVLRLAGNNEAGLIVVLMLTVGLLTTRQSAPINYERSAGNERGRIARQVERRSGDLFR